MAGPLLSQWETMLNQTCELTVIPRILWWNLGAMHLFTLTMVNKCLVGHVPPPPRLQFSHCRPKGSEYMHIVCPLCLCLWLVDLFYSTTTLPLKHNSNTGIQELFQA